MGNKQPEISKYANMLALLGFTQTDKEYSLKIRKIGLSRNERRLLRTMKYRPWFTATSLATFTTDETGQTWAGPANIDLSHIGFDGKPPSTPKNQDRNKNRRFN